MPTVEMEMEGLCQVLRHHPVGSLRGLQVEEAENEVVLSGTLASFYHKQLAQEALLPHLSGRRLINQVEVIRG